jgi:hypothetical protein
VKERAGKRSEKLKKRVGRGKKVKGGWRNGVME